MLLNSFTSKSIMKEFPQKWRRQIILAGSGVFRQVDSGH